MAARARIGFCWGVAWVAGAVVAVALASCGIPCARAEDQPRAALLRDELGLADPLPGGPVLHSICPQCTREGCHMGGDRPTPAHDLVGQNPATLGGDVVSDHASSDTADRSAIRGPLRRMRVILGHGEHAKPKGRFLRFPCKAVEHAEHKGVECSLKLVLDLIARDLGRDDSGNRVMGHADSLACRLVRSVFIICDEPSDLRRHGVASERAGPRSSLVVLPEWYAAICHTYGTEEVKGRRLRYARQQQPADVILEPYNGVVGEAALGEDRGAGLADRHHDLDTIGVDQQSGSEDNALVNDHSGWTWHFVHLG